MNSVHERRRTRRRSLPYVRSAILETGGNSHIVAVTDLSAEGAFVSTRLPLSADESVTLRLVLPRDGKVAALPCQVVWQSERFDPKTGRPAGIAVRFKGLDASAVRRFEEFSMEGFLPASSPTPQDHFEYRVLERFAVDLGELNALGLDGWALQAAVPIPTGVQLVLMRRL